MKINPILKKELRVGSRSIRPSIALAIYVLFLVFVMLFSVAQKIQDHLVWGDRFDFMALSDLFSTMSLLGLILLLVIMPPITAGSIAGERERSTLDIMLSAPVRSFTIAMGKLLSALVWVLMLVSSSIPILAVTFLYGGIQWQYLLVFLIMMMSVAFFNGALGIWCSSLFRRTVPAIVLTYVLEAVFYGLTLLIVWLTIQFGAGKALMEDGAVMLGSLPLVLLLNPGFTFVDAIQSAYSGQSLMQQVTSGEYFLDYRYETSALIESMSGHWLWYGILILFLLASLCVFLTAFNLRRGSEVKEKRLRTNDR